MRQSLLRGVLNANTGTLMSDPAIASLYAMFPAFDQLVLRSVLEATGGNRDRAIDSLLAMSDPDYAPAQPQTTGGGAPNQGRQPTQTELDEEFAHRLMLEEQQAHGAAWPPRDQISHEAGHTQTELGEEWIVLEDERRAHTAAWPSRGQTSPHNVFYQTHQPRRRGEYHRHSSTRGGGINNAASDLQQQFRSFISDAGRRTGARWQPQGQGSTRAEYQEQFNMFADTGKKTFNSIVNKVK
ncbi:hypothetical protein FRC10_004741 [Ceratobasidium sp. 414]|nr:hypothetical protein FRC10_004741 [Ceratobasidium sp. 414]